MYSVYRRKNANVLERLLAPAREAGWHVRLWALDEEEQSLESETLGAGAGTKFELVNKLLADTPPEAGDYAVRGGLCSRGGDREAHAPPRRARRTRMARPPPYAGNVAPLAEACALAWSGTDEQAVVGGGEALCSSLSRIAPYELGGRLDPLTRRA